MESKRRVISLLVDNQSGVLARVSNLFCRRGFNIDSLTVSATNDPTVSRITVAVSGTEKELNQLILQTERLEVTRQVFVLNHENALERDCCCSRSPPMSTTARSCGRWAASTRPRSSTCPRTAWSLS